MIISVENLVKSYGPVQAVKGISFSVNRGEIFGLLGPNGAGKTTVIETLIGLRKADEGHVVVLGTDVSKASASFRERIGVQLQTTSLFPRIRVEEAFKLFATFYANALNPNALIERLGLTHRKKAKVSTLSGGERQRVALGLALINDPELLFLDELSSGIDPVGRRELWDLLRDLRDEGKTIFMTTHLMDEAEALCSKVLFLRNGEIIAEGEPSELIAAHKSDNLDDLYIELVREP